MDIAFNITRKCNKNCDYCYLDLTREDLPFDNIKEIFRSIKVNTVTLTGGEPLIHPDIENIISFVSKKGYHIHLLTNGILLTGSTLDVIVKSGAELFVTYNHPQKNIKKNLKKAFQRGLEINLHHVLTYSSFESLEDICEDIPFAKSILLIYPTDLGSHKLDMYSPDEWFPLLQNALDVISKYNIKTYFEQSFIKKDSKLVKNQPCPTGNDIFIDVNGKAYPCCLLVDILQGEKEVSPIRMGPEKCNFLKNNFLSTASEYVRICPIAITDSYDGLFTFPSHTGVE